MEKNEAPNKITPSKRQGGEGVLNGSQGADHPYWREARARVATVAMELDAGYYPCCRSDFQRQTCVSYVITNK